MKSDFLNTQLDRISNHCQVCFRPFEHEEITTVGMLPSGAHRVVGECCADILTEVIDRGVYTFVTDTDDQLDGLFSGFKGAFGRINPDKRTFSGGAVTQEQAPPRAPNAGQYTDAEIINLARLVPESEWTMGIRHEAKKILESLEEGAKVSYIIWPDGIVFLCGHSANQPRPRDEFLITSYRRLAGLDRMNEGSGLAASEAHASDDHQVQSEIACPGCDQVTEEFQVLGAGFNGCGDVIGFGFCRQCSSEFHRGVAEEALIPRATERVNANPGRYGHPVFLQHLLAGNNGMEAGQ